MYFTAINTQKSHWSVPINIPLCHSFLHLANLYFSTAKRNIYLQSLCRMFSLNMQVIFQMTFKPSFPLCSTFLETSYSIIAIIIIWFVKLLALISIIHDINCLFEAQNKLDCSAIYRS
jgi:hypothetical protein